MAADYEAMRTQIIEFIIEEYVEDDSMTISNDTPLISSGLVDSFSMVSMKMYLEEEYQVQLSDEEASTDAFDTVDRIMELMKGKLG